MSDISAVEKKKEFIRLVKEYLDSANNSENISPWREDDPRWEEIVNFAKSRFLKKIASKYSYWLGKNLNDAVCGLLYNLFMVLQGLRKNKTISNLDVNESYSYIVAAVENSLRNEMRGGHSGEESIEGNLEIGKEPGYDQLDEDYYMRWTLLPAFINTISDLKREKSDSISLKYGRIFLARFVVETIKSMPDLHSLNDATHIMKHERDTVEQLEQQFILFCMQDQTIRYDKFAKILENELGKYHDMTMENEDLRPYLDYCLDQEVNIPIIDKVISSYLYSAGVKGRDRVHAVAANTVSENYKRTCQLLKIKITNR